MKFIVRSNYIKFLNVVVGKFIKRANKNLTRMQKPIKNYRVKIDREFDSNRVVKNSKLTNMYMNIFFFEKSKIL